MSRITRLNTALRNRQEVQTIVNQIQVAMWAENDPSVRRCLIVTGVDLINMTLLDKTTSYLSPSGQMA